MAQINFVMVQLDAKDDGVWELTPEPILDRDDRILLNDMPPLEERPATVHFHFGEAVKILERTVYVNKAGDLAWIRNMDIPY